MAAGLASGTFYLLVYGLAAVAAGVAAWLGAGFIAQLVTAGVVAVAGTLALRHWKRSTGHPESTVQVESWQGSRGADRSGPTPQGRAAGRGSAGWHCLHTEPVLPTR